MALNLVVRYKFLSFRGGWAIPGMLMEVYWDDSIDDYFVQTFTTEAATTPITRTASSPGTSFVSLGAIRTNYSIIAGFPQNTFDRDAPSADNYYSNYKFCDGANLQVFKVDTRFPFAKKVSLVDHFSCAPVVCDLQISDTFTTVPPSTATTLDGEIHVTATSSNGPIKFSLRQNFDYNSNEGLATGDFINLPPGDYTVTAKDAAGCADQINIKLNVQDPFEVLFRQEHKDLHGVPTRTDILERGYSGAITEVKGTEDPVILRYNAFGETDRFKAIIPSQLTMNWISETNFQFRRLFTQDERKYRVQHYKNFGSGFQLIWQGYVLASNYSETYTKTPYPVTIVATDGLEDLKDFDWVSRLDVPFKEEITPLNAIVEALRPTDQGINIMSAINRYEAAMSTGVADDPLNQCTFNPKTFYFEDEIKSCYEVIEEILKSFGARLLQRDGKWLIYSIEEAVASMPYREFNAGGEYLSNGIINDVRDIKPAPLSNRAVFSDRDQVLETLPSYGKMFFEHTLQEVPSLIQSHGFEKSDLYETPDGVTVINGWNVNIQNHPGATYGIKETKALDGDYNFYVKRGNINVPRSANKGTVSLIAKPFMVEYDRTDAFELKFDYAIVLGLYASNSPEAKVNPYWVKIKWMLKVGNHYFDSVSGTWTTDSSYQFNELYAEAFNKKDNFEILGNFREVTAVTTEEVSFQMILTFETTYDVYFGGSSGNLISEVKALPTTKLREGYRIKAAAFTPNAVTTEEFTITVYYVLVKDLSGDSGIETIRPNDFNDVSTPYNIKVWKFEERNKITYSNTRFESWNTEPDKENNVQYIYVDNVVFKHYPRGEEIPKNITIERTNNQFIKLEYNQTYLLNDIDTTNVNNSERTFINFYKRLDGTPTQEWTRTYRPGTDNLLALLSNDFATQYRLPSNKLTGSLHYDVRILPSSVMRETADGGRKYMFMGYELHDRDCSIVFDLAEVKDPITDPDSDDIYADFNTDFSEDFMS
jgi:hypothetical protein